MYIIVYNTAGYLPIHDDSEGFTSYKEAKRAIVQEMRRIRDERRENGEKVVVYGNAADGYILHVADGYTLDENLEIVWKASH